MDLTVNPTALYIRLSQNRNGDLDKPERQRSICADWMRARGIDTWDEYLDNDLSAFRGKKRPDWQRLLGDIRADRKARIVTLHMDRALRDSKDLEKVIDLAEEHPFTIEGVQSGSLDLQNSAGRQQARLLVAISSGESERKAERHRDKAAQLRSQGKSTGGMRPFGWVSPNGALEPREAEMIRTGITQILEGGTLYGVRKQWMATGVTSPMGNPWPTNKSVGRVLIRWRNAGLVEHAGKVVGPAVWPAIATQAEVAAVRQILADPARKTTPGPARKHLLSGIIRCGKCGANMRKAQQPRRDGTQQCYYRCSGDGCYVAIDQAKADQVVSEKVRFMFSVRDVASFSMSGNDRQTLLDLRAEKAEIEETSNNIAEMVGRGEWTLRMAQTTTSGLMSRMTEIDYRLAQIASRMAIADMLVDSAVVNKRVDFEKAVAVKAKWESLTLEKKRAIITELFGFIVVKPGRASAEDRISFPEKENK